MQLVGLLVLFVAVSFAGAAKTKLDSLIPLCSRTDPNLNDCVKKSGQQIIPWMVKGIRDYGFPSVDPMKIPFLGLSQSDGPVGLKLNISDTIHDGIGNTQVAAARMDVKKGHWEVDIVIPRYSITGVCDLGGRILLLPISGHGPCNLTSYDMFITINIDGQPTMTNSKEFFKPSSIKVTVKFTKGSFLLSGLFGGNKELGATMNRFLNENALEVLNEMKPTLQNVWSELFGGLLLRFFNSVPYDELLMP